MVSLLAMVVLAILLMALAVRGMADLFGFQLPPGPGTPTLTAERMAVLGPITWYLLKGVQINGSATTDAGNTPTTNLRHGLLMGLRTADGLAANYNPTGSDGSQLVQGFLWESRDTIDTDGLTVNPTAQIVIAGYVRSSQLLLLDEQCRRQMQGRFIFDDRIPGAQGGARQTIAKTANYNVVASDSDSRFTNTGAAGSVQFTLPAVAKGARFFFYATAAQTLEVSAPSAILLVGGSAHTNITFSTGGAIVGAWVVVEADDSGAFWIAQYGGGTATLS